MMKVTFLFTDRVVCVVLRIWTNAWVHVGTFIYVCAQSKHNKRNRF